MFKATSRIVTALFSSITAQKPGSRFSSVCALTRQVPKRRHHLGKGVALLRARQTAGKGPRDSGSRLRGRYKGHGSLGSLQGCRQGLRASGQTAKVGVSSTPGHAPGRVPALKRRIQEPSEQVMGKFPALHRAFHHM